MNYGKHLMLRIGNIENIEAINNDESIKNFLTDLTHHIGMRVLVPAVTGYEDGEPQNRGFSGVIILVESHIAIHVYSELRQAFLDVFSCKDYDEEDVFEFLRDRIGGFEVIEKTVLNRGRHWDADIKKEMENWRTKR